MFFAMKDIHLVYLAGRCAILPADLTTGVGQVGHCGRIRGVVLAGISGTRKALGLGERGPTGAVDSMGKEIKWCTSMNGVEDLSFSRANF